jgi:hypothetical protein
MDRASPRGVEQRRRNRVDDCASPWSHSPIAFTAAAMQRTLIVIGATLVVVGLAWPWIGRLPLGRLPGDLMFNRGGFRLYVPLTTMLLISAVLSLLLWLFRR